MPKRKASSLSIAALEQPLDTFAECRSWYLTHATREEFRSALETCLHWFTPDLHRRSLSWSRRGFVRVWRLWLKDGRVNTDMLHAAVNRIRQQRAVRLQLAAMKSVTTRGIRERYASNWTSIIQFMKTPADPITGPGIGVVLYGFYAPPTVMIGHGSVIIDSRACIQLARENGATLRRAAVMNPQLIEDFRLRFDEEKNMRAHDDHLVVRLLDAWTLPDTVITDSPRAYTRGTDMLMSVREDFEIVPSPDYRADEDPRVFQYVTRLHGIKNGTLCEVGFFVIDAALSMVIGHLTTLLDHIPTVAQLIGEYLMCETWMYDFYSESAFGRRLASGEAALKRSRFNDIVPVELYDAAAAAEFDEYLAGDNHFYDYLEDENNAGGPVGAPYNGAMVDDFPA